MPQAKTEAVLQFSECCAAETALQHWLLCSAEVIWPKSCVDANEKLHCNIEKAALQESGAFLPLSCGFQAPTFRHPRFGPAEIIQVEFYRVGNVFCGGWHPFCGTVRPMLTFIQSCWSKLLRSQTVVWTSSASSKPTQICTAPFEHVEMTQIKHAQTYSLTTSHAGTNTPKFALSRLG